MQFTCSVHEGMAHDETFQQICGFFDDPIVVTKLGAHDGGFKCPHISDSQCTAKQGNLVIVDS